MSGSIAVNDVDLSAFAIESETIDKDDPTSPADRKSLTGCLKAQQR